MRRAAGLGLLLATSSAWAEPSTPYLDRLKQNLPEEKTESGSYTENLKSKLPPEDPSRTGSYIEKLKRENPEPESPGDSYLQAEKAKLGGPSTKSSIQDVLDGKSDLKPERRGNIHHAAGFRMGASFSRTLTASTEFQAKPFAEIYSSGTQWVPDVTLFYEYQPFHSEWFGNFGVVGMFGVAYFKGKGKFGNATLLAPSGVPFGAESRTNFTFLNVPLFVGVNYRFNLLRIIRPYVQAGPAMNLYFESRNDGEPPVRARSQGAIASGGINILLDWISPSTAHELYLDMGVQHFYLTLDYSRSFTFSGPISFDSSVFSAGMTYEF